MVAKSSISSVGRPGALFRSFLLSIRQDTPSATRRTEDTEETIGSAHAGAQGSEPGPGGE